MGRNKKKVSSNTTRLNKKGSSIQTGKKVRMVVLKDPDIQNSDKLFGDRVVQKKNNTSSALLESVVTIKKPLVVEHSPTWIDKLVNKFDSVGLPLSRILVSLGWDAVISKSNITNETIDIFLLSGQRDKRFKIGE